MNEDFFAKIDQILTSAAFNIISPVSASEFFATLILAVVAGSVLFIVYSTALITRQNDRRFAFLLVLILLVTCIIITFIKSSLVLSIGLIGALSIVRFRTPVKDAFDLGFLFAAIAFGIGFGAGQIQFAFIALIIFTIVVYGFSIFLRKNNPLTDYAVEISKLGSVSDVREIQKLLESTFDSVVISRLDMDDGTVDVYFELCVLGREDITAGLSKVSASYPDCDVKVFNVPA